MIEEGGLGAACPTGARESGLGAGSGCAAGGGAAVPDLGWGAGLGTGTVCAIAATAVRHARMVHAMAACLALRIASLRCPPAPRSDAVWRFRDLNFRLSPPRNHRRFGPGAQ